MSSPNGFPVQRFQALETPFYYYDTALLSRTLDAALDAMRAVDPACLHYAVKANNQSRILGMMAAKGLGADCVSGGEVKAALSAGIPPERIVFAGVAKADWEIRLGLEEGIFCFNVESEEELEVISEIAAEMGKVSRVALRINPDVAAHTHKNIQTGQQEDKFGIHMDRMIPLIQKARKMKSVEVIGLHFHIGSQILDMNDFRDLCLRVNALQDKLEASGIHLEHINLGGGLGVSYTDVDEHLLPDFQGFFSTIRQYLKVRPFQTLHFEFGRCLVAQSGSLITRVLYVKKAVMKQFAILDAGMTDLIRPALYQAHHQIENLTSEKEETLLYDVVGPICESTDVFALDERLPLTRRGDIVAIRSAGAYGQSMASEYNLRPLAPAVYSDTLS